MKPLIVLLAACALMAPSALIHAQTQTCATPERMPTEEEMTVIVLTNNYRQSLGLQPLAYDQTLTNAARWKAQQNAAIGSDEHNDPFQTWEQRFVACGVDMSAGWHGENLAAGFHTAAEVVGGWQASPEHNANLLRPEFTRIGVAVADGIGPYWTYFVMELGQ